MKNENSEKSEIYRNKIIKFRVNNEELEFIKKRAAQSQTKSLSEFLRKMAVAGFVINLNLTQLAEIQKNFNYIRADINQIAKRANSTGRVYDEDIEYIKKITGEIWESLKSVQSKLRSL